MNEVKDESENKESNPTGKPLLDELRQFIFESWCPGGCIFSVLWGSSLCLLFMRGIFAVFSWAPLITWVAIGVIMELDLRIRK